MELTSTICWVIGWSLVTAAAILASMGYAKYRATSKQQLQLSQRLTPAARSRVPMRPVAVMPIATTTADVKEGVPDREVNTTYAAPLPTAPPAFVPASAPYLPSFVVDSDVIPADIAWPPVPTRPLVQYNVLPVLGAMTDDESDRDPGTHRARRQISARRFGDGRGRVVQTAD